MSHSRGGTCFSRNWGSNFKFGIAWGGRTRGRVGLRRRRSRKETGDGPLHTRLHVLFIELIGVAIERGAKRRGVPRHHQDREKGGYAAWFMGSNTWRHFVPFCITAVVTPPASFLPFFAPPSPPPHAPLVMPRSLRAPSRFPVANKSRWNFHLVPPPFPGRNLLREKAKNRSSSPRYKVGWIGSYFSAVDRTVDYHVHEIIFLRE